MNSDIKIAIADDHVILRKGLIDMITSFGGFKVIIEAGNGVELLDAIKRAKTLPDIVMLDINMPQKNGYETLLELKKSFPTVRTLILTMFDNEQMILKMLRSGANGYLLKTCEPADIRTALRTIHEKEYYHSDFISNNLYKGLENEDKLMSKITDREMEFLSHVCDDLTYSEIASLMNVSVRTVEKYRDTLFLKLGIKTRTGLVMHTIRMGLVSINK